jgi:hypothetical protein
MTLITHCGSRLCIAAVDLILQVAPGRSPARQLWCLPYFLGASRAKSFLRVGLRGPPTFDEPMRDADIGRQVQCLVTDMRIIWRTALAVTATLTTMASATPVAARPPGWCTHQFSLVGRRFIME